MALSNTIVIVIVVVGTILVASFLVILAVMLIAGSSVNRTYDADGGGYITSKGECAKEPPTYPDLYSNWDGKSRKLATVVQYRCGYVPETPVARAVQCRSTSGWEITYDNLKVCNLDSEGKAIRDSFERSSQLRGCHRSEPPPAGNYYRDWNRLRWEEGTSINYYCSAQKNSPLVKTVICRQDRKWGIVKENKVSCECKGKPPLYDDYEDRLVWDPSSIWMGTTIGYRCSANPNSKFWKILQCNVSGLWTVEETRKC